MSFPVIRPEDVEDLPPLAVKALQKALRIECQEAASRHQAIVFRRRRAARTPTRPPVPVDAAEVIAERRAVLRREEVPAPRLVGGIWRWSAA